MTKVFDVVIVGAGPAGSALGIYLARAGIDVLLLEKYEFPRDKVCGDFVSPRGLKKLAELGCGDEISARAYTQVNRSLVFLGDDQLSEGLFPHLPEHPAFGHAIPRCELDDIIFRQAQKCGVETVENCLVVGIVISDDGVQIDADVAGKIAAFKGKMVVGADGANSIVARNVNLEMRDQRYVQLAMRAYCKGLPHKDAVLYFEEEFFPGFGWVFPVNDRVANIGVGMVKEPMKKDGIHLRTFFNRFTKFVHRLGENSGVKIEISRSSGWPIKTYGGARRNYFERGLLIGDAGCFVDPISGEGIPLALETSEIASETIVEALASGDVSAAGLSSFEHRWREHFDADLGISDLVVSMIRNRYLVKLWVQWLRVMGMTAMRDPDYALKTGGILAGLVPNRQGLSPDVVLKSIVHGPAFWMEAADISATNLPQDLVKRGADLLRWEIGLARAVVTDPDWFRDWAVEIGTKQMKVFRNLANLASPVDRS